MVNEKYKGLRRTGWNVWTTRALSYEAKRSRLNDVRDGFSQGSGGVELCFVDVSIAPAIFGSRYELMEVAR